MAWRRLQKRFDCLNKFQIRKQMNILSNSPITTFKLAKSDFAANFDVSTSAAPYISLGCITRQI